MILIVHDIISNIQGLFKSTCEHLISNHHHYIYSVVIIMTYYLNIRLIQQQHYNSIRKKGIIEQDFHRWILPKLLKWDVFEKGSHNINVFVLQLASLVDVEKLLVLFVQFGIPQCSTGEGKMDVQCGYGGGDVDSHSSNGVVGCKEDMVTGWCWG